MTDRAFWIAIRKALLEIVAYIEDRWDITPRTKDCRDEYRRRAR